MLILQFVKTWGDMTVETLLRATGRRGGTIHCGLCEHRFAAAVADQYDAVAFARTHGWIIDDIMRCPMCAATQAASLDGGTQPTGHVQCCDEEPIVSERG